MPFLIDGEFPNFFSSRPPSVGKFSSENSFVWHSMKEKLLSLEKQRRDMHPHRSAYPHLLSSAVADTQMCHSVIHWNDVPWWDERVNKWHYHFIIIISSGWMMWIGGVAVDGIHTTLILHSIAVRKIDEFHFVSKRRQLNHKIIKWIERLSVVQWLSHDECWQRWRCFGMNSIYLHGMHGLHIHERCHSNLPTSCDTPNWNTVLSIDLNEMLDTDKSRRKRKMKNRRRDVIVHRFFFPLQLRQRQ